MRSKSSRRKLHIKYREDQDFWSFYMANSEDIDYIIDASCRMFKNIVPTEDMKLDILIELYRSGFLNRFDSTKARLNTYITSLVRGYAKTIAEREDKDLFRVCPECEGEKYIDGQTCHVCDGSGHARRLTQVLDSALNADTDESLHLESNEENAGPDNLDVRFLKELAGKLEKPYHKLFELIMQDKSNQEIAKLLKVSDPCISWKCNMLVEKLRKLASKELNVREKLLLIAGDIQGRAKIVP